ncbi:MAG: NAD(P)/FAD-dependent oxidoreductase [Rubripirellula sp.]
MKRHAIVVGGGVIGLSLAWELAKRGTQVSVVDRALMGRATSWAGAGILPPANRATATDPIDQLRGLSHELYPKWGLELKSATAIDPELHRCGGLYLAETPGERASMLGMTEYWRELSINCERWEPSDLVQREPALESWIHRVDNAAAWFVPDEYQIRPPRYLRALLAACRDCGVELIDAAEVTDVRVSDGTAAIHYLDQWHSSDAIVLTSGAWTGRIAPSLQLDHSVIPVRGQILLLKTEAPITRSVINVGQRYIVCRDDGHTLIGSCEEETGFELGTTDAVLDSLHQFASELIPELGMARRAGAWSGLRPMTFDGFPMIGRMPDCENLFVAAGHYRSGLHLAPGTAVVVADLIDGMQPCIDLAPFRVGKQQHDQTTQ